MNSMKCIIFKNGLKRTGGLIHAVWNSSDVQQHISYVQNFNRRSKGKQLKWCQVLVVQFAILRCLAISLFSQSINNIYRRF